MQLWLFWADMEAIGAQNMAANNLMEAAQMVLEMYIMDGSPLWLELTDDERANICERILHHASLTTEPTAAQIRGAFRPAELVVHKRLAVLVYTAPVNDETSSLNIVDLIMPQPTIHRRLADSVDRSSDESKHDDASDHPADGKPADHKEHTMEISSGVWSITCQLLGSRIVTIPYYMANCGWTLGFAMIVVFAGLSFATLLLEHRLGSIVGINSLPMLADRAFGTLGWYTANAAIFLLNFGGFIGRLFILGSTIPALLRAVSITHGTNFSEHRQYTLLAIAVYPPISPSPQLVACPSMFPSIPALMFPSIPVFMLTSCIA